MRWYRRRIARWRVCAGKELSDRRMRWSENRACTESAVKTRMTVLEETFKEHNTLNPQILALAKQLDLDLMRPRQVEVWFQNRRGAAKSKRSHLQDVSTKKKDECN